MIKNDYLLNKSWERINKLTEQSQNLLDYQKKCTDLKNKIQTKREKVKQLREKREQLLAILKSEYDPDSNFTFTLPENITEDQKQVLNELKGKLQHLEPTKQAYRFLGKSFITLPDEPNLMGIRLETFFEGKFYKPFYMFFSRSGDSLTLARHTLPSHVPIQFLLDQYLEDNLEKLIEICHEYIINYVKSLQGPKGKDAIELSHPNGLSEEFNILES